MKRVLMSLGVAVLALIGLAAPLIQLSDDADPTVDPVTISDYRADYRIAHDGELTARESISTLFPPSRHGIFRFWDVTDAADPHVRYIPDAIAVTLDGHAVPVELSWEANRRFRVAKIGDPDSYLSPGTHVFVITYRVDGVLAPARGGTSGTDARFLWRVVPDGWRMPHHAVGDPHRTPRKTTGRRLPCRRRCTLHHHRERSPVSHRDHRSAAPDDGCGVPRRPAVGRTGSHRHAVVAVLRRRPRPIPAHRDCTGPRVPGPVRRRCRVGAPQS